MCIRDRVSVPPCLGGLYDFGLLVRSHQLVPDVPRNLTLGDVAGALRWALAVFAMEHPSLWIGDIEVLLVRVHGVALPEENDLPQLVVCERLQPAEAFLQLARVLLVGSAPLPTRGLIHAHYPVSSSLWIIAWRRSQHRNWNGSNGCATDRGA